MNETWKYDKLNCSTWERGAGSVEVSCNDNHDVWVSDVKNEGDFIFDIKF